MILNDSERSLEREAIRIRDKAWATKGAKERERLLLLAECMWPSDPAMRMADILEHQRISALHPQTLD